MVQNDANGVVVTCGAAPYRRPDEHVEAALVRPEGRDLPVVPRQAGGAQAGLAAQEGRRLVHAVAAQLEAALVRAAAEQTHVLRERRRGEDEGGAGHARGQVRTRQFDRQLFYLIILFIHTTFICFLNKSMSTLTRWIRNNRS